MEEILMDTILLEDGHALNMGEGRYVVTQHDEYGVAQTVSLAAADIQSMLDAS